MHVLEARSAQQSGKMIRDLKKRPARMAHPGCQHGLARRIALRAPLLATSAALAQSDMIAVIGERSAREFARLAPLEVLRLPFESPKLTTAMLWHRRLDDVAAHRWLRSLALKVARSV